MELSKKLIKSNIIKAGIDDSDSSFYNDAVRYVKAAKQNRLICHTSHVSKSGMIRHLRIIELTKNHDTSFYMLGFHSLMKNLGYKQSKYDYDYFVIKGGNMDMVFNTNHHIMRHMYDMGFMSKKEWDELSQTRLHLF